MITMSFRGVRTSNPRAPTLCNVRASSKWNLLSASTVCATYTRSTTKMPVEHMLEAKGTTGGEPPPGSLTCPPPPPSVSHPTLSTVLHLIVWSSICDSRRRLLGRQKPSAFIGSSSKSKLIAKEKKKKSILSTAVRPRAPRPPELGSTPSYCPDPERPSRFHHHNLCSQKTTDCTTTCFSTQNHIAGKKGKTNVSPLPPRSRPRLTVGPRECRTTTRAHVRASPYLVQRLHRRLLELLSLPHPQEVEVGHV